MTANPKRIRLMFTVWASLKTSFNTQQHINVTKRSIYDAYMIYSVKNKSNSSYRRALWVAACWGGPWKPLKPKLWGFITLRAFHPRGQTTCFSGLQESQLSESATLACWFGFVQKIWRGQKGPVNGIWLPSTKKSQKISIFLGYSRIFRQLGIPRGFYRGFIEK